MRKLGGLFIFILVCGIGQYLHATSCVDETDQEGGECKTSACALPCDQAGFGIGGLQARRSPVPHVLLTTTAQVASSLNQKQHSLSLFPLEVHTPFILSSSSASSGHAHREPSGQTWAVVPTNAIFKQAAANGEVWQLKSWRV